MDCDLSNILFIMFILMVLRGRLCVGEDASIFYDFESFFPIISRMPFSPKIL